MRVSQFFKIVCGAGAAIVRIVSYSTLQSPAPYRLQRGACLLQGVQAARPDIFEGLLDSPDGLVAQGLFVVRHDTVWKPIRYQAHGSEDGKIRNAEGEI